MATQYSVLFDAFLKKIERDRKFFSYMNVSPAVAEDIIETRCMAFLDEACGRIMMECSPSVDFSDRNDEEQTFSFDLTAREKYIIPNLMYESYLSRDIAYLKNLSVNYSPTDLRVYDPSNWRSSFMAMYTSVCEENKRMMDEYRNRDRADGSFITIDYDLENIDD